MTRFANLACRALGVALCVAAVGCSTSRVGRPDASGLPIAETVCEFARNGGPEGLSGITAIRNDRYFSVDDRGGMLHELEIVVGEEGDVRECRVKRSVRLEGRVDLEGCAYDPLDGRVWVSDEHDTSIRQFDPETGKETGAVTVPEIFSQNVVPNRSFEALAISPNGMAMYVANEDTLKCDGGVADKKHGGLVRIQEFVRFAKGGTWVATRQLRYRTEPVEGDPFSGIAISGVAAMCVADDGNLLVLEREMSQKNPLFPSFHARIFEVPLKNAADGSKRLIWEENTMFSNYEGLCKGPKLNDGSQSLILVSDGGGGAEKNILVVARHR